MSTVIDGLDYGPLACLVGRWRGDGGVDVAPEDEGEERNPYYETMVMIASGDVSNADRQDLAIVRYHQSVSRISNNEEFHNESGYYTWEADTGLVTQSFVIPRGVAVVAGGSAEISSTGVRIQVNAALGDDDWGITQSPFMRDNASTQSFSHLVTVEGDQLRYEETTVVDIFDKIFDHTDCNILTRVVDD
jgi:hypothetical protein